MPVLLCAAGRHGTERCRDVDERLWRQPPSQPTLAVITAAPRRWRKQMSVGCRQDRNPLTEGVGC
ncbi:hypothetical protein E2C01_078027 [Portunus trituberculatus]|uniref:Uncharacterized protein n=1 Tax=Portunus trituberculatus TaxID=210409 RepID=A0A5B7IMT5_PORTR|nr:hypothetical protein [Portunus trituberculatus]